MPEMRTHFSRGRYELKNATMVDLIRTAWGVDADKVVGGPDWLDLDRFDVIATVPATPGVTAEALQPMLRKLLEDRFQLVARKDTRDLPAYVLSSGGKPRLERADDSEKADCEVRRGPNPAPSQNAVLDCRNMTMAASAKALTGLRQASGYLFDYPVVDRTGLAGAWNYTVTFTPRDAMRANPPAPDAVTIFDAFEKQLGLKLKLTKVPTPVVVVERVNEKPVGNLTGAVSKPAPLEFEVADIKPDDSGAQCGYVNIQPGGRVRINMTLKFLVVEAWGALIPPQRIVGGPKFMDGTCFVVLAKAPVEENAAPGWNGAVWNGVDIDSMRMMLRALLVDRFALAAHMENRPIPGYELVSGKLKLRKADPSNRAGCKEGPGPDGVDPRITNPIASRLITCRNMTIAQFAAELNRMFVELPPLVDSTGIAGRYDMTINFSPANAFRNIATPDVGGGTAAADPNGAITFSEALNRQLGLKFRSREVMAPVLVIDHVNEMPTPN